jgi:eukaryotic-like serine/threonine-protein kinase
MPRSKRTDTDGDLGPAFDGTARFAIERRLGSGGMGVVYEAYDRERQMSVALKTLRRPDPDWLYRFKKEFRALADIVHPNLVSLYELVSIDEQWFFTMELLEGEDFLTWVRGGDAAATDDRVAWTGDRDPELDPDRDGDRPSTETLETVTGVGVAAPPRPAPPPPDLHRLRRGLEQLGRGVHALHEAGYLHSDIKPSNVMVTREGRVVLLDFGIITEMTEAGRARDSGELAGTPAYMAPEQVAADGAPAPASDWYSVGVMLYEALTGQRPFRGATSFVLEAKRQRGAGRPRWLWPETPPDLDQLCADLLQIHPADRPTGREILDRLGAGAAPSSSEASRPPADAPGALVGRDAPLAALRDALAETRRGAGVTVLVHGQPGTGKTALIRAFLDQAAREGDAVILEGRCYERESVPYKAVDSLVDALCRFLLGLSRHDADALMPRDVVMLARVFPVLRRVEAVTSARRRSAMIPEPHELRRRAFGALRELFTRIAERYLLIAFIDDLQWGDLDSAPLLEALLRPPDPPPMLLVASYRTDDASRSPLLRDLLDRPSLAARRVALEPLPPDEARALATALLLRAKVDPGAADTIARESNGNPYFVHELVRFMVDELGVQRLRQGSLTLDEVIRARVGRLPDGARRLLEMIVVAGKPIAQKLALQASEIDGDVRTVMQQLSAAQLIRLSGVRNDDLIEPYHDRIRETISAELETAARRAHHLRLALTLESQPHPDAEDLALHYQGAGDPDTAADYAEAAAEQAARALAFDRAAELFGLALELQGPQTTPALAGKLGDALANAGRGAEAARVYLAAAPGAGTAESLQLRRRAALQYLRAGHIDEGLETLRAVLESVGLRLPPTTRSSLRGLALRRAWLRLRGFRYRRRDASQISSEELTRIDICVDAAYGLSLVDVLRSTYFQTLAVLLALRAGEPYRVTRGMILEIPFMSLAGPSVRKRILKMHAEVGKLAEEMDLPEMRAWHHGSLGLADFLLGRFREARDAMETGTAILREHCTGVAWELASGELCHLWSLYYLGDVRVMAALVGVRLEEARQRGDLYTTTNLRTGVPAVTWLMADDPEEARRGAEAAASGWSTHGFHMQHFWALFALTQRDLYLGDGAAAYERVCGAWKDLKRAFILRIQFNRTEIVHLRGRAALCAAETAADPRPLLRAARRDARRIAREKMGWATPLAALLEAGVAVGEGNEHAALARLVAAEDGFEAAGMQLYRMAAQRRRGQLTPGADGARLVAEATEWMTGQGIVNPERMTAMLAPLGRRVDAPPGHTE